MHFGYAAGQLSALLSGVLLTPMFNILNLVVNASNFHII
jgi:hypothetical protein